MKNRNIIAAIIILFYSSLSVSQSYYFGIKGGSSLGYQKWESFNQKPVFTFHIASFIESYSEANPLNSLYAQFGFHNRGSALRNALVYTLDGSRDYLPTQKFIFKNLSLGLGAKRKQQINDNLKSFYSFGLRLEYTTGTNLDDYVEINNRYSTPYFPDNLFVKKFMYGATVGGGLEFSFSELIEGLFEISVNPDLSNQYDQPEIQGIVDPYHPSNTTTLRRRRIKNTTIEVTFGIRFMRKVEYID